MLWKYWGSPAYSRIVTLDDVFVTHKPSIASLKRVQSSCTPEETSPDRGVEPEETSSVDADGPWTLTQSCNLLRPSSGVCARVGNDDITHSNAVRNHRVGMATCELASHIRKGGVKRLIAKKIKLVSSTVLHDATTHNNLTHTHNEEHGHKSVIAPLPHPSPHSSFHNFPHLSPFPQFRRFTKP